MTEHGDGGDLAESWSRVGADGSLGLDAIDLWWIELAFRRPVGTASQTYRRRPLALVRVRANSPSGPVEGWGECAALGDAAYVPEDVATAFGTLERGLGPVLVEEAARHGGRLPAPTELAHVQREAAHSSMAFAALEMGVADAHLRAEGRSLASVLGVEGRRVEAGAVVGTSASMGELLAAVQTLVDRCFGRVKLKIEPGWDVSPVATVREAFPALLLQVDANGSYDESDTAHLVELDRFGLLCIEQPFGSEELDAHARLASRLETPICLDESLDSPGRVTEALAMGACSVVCVKPARLGGIGATLEVVDSCRNAGTPMWMGGMFESSYARGVNAAIAALDGFAWPGDLSAPSGPAGYLADDVLVSSDVSYPIDDSALVALPEGAGMGRAPDLDLLRLHLVRRTTLGADPPAGA